ncbi:LacI family DNA-binding transcriptional regulator [Herbaspirillum sp. WKF16]|uniref:LacI family DNA-binding transcriptional regulator n=1 Tax=Herbaspirillum sp. WKF16 TaxID=3028312 RepID=UPI0023A9E6BD|nr:LacI family DNA-binding transcriptional regulator [Herbaspirillum sp. WKF16]WDZ95050.1 LacI family DNA-binding transcriptional regulator [Herbaspirillum sp. WKF16]
MADVAELAGVSKMSVSRVLTGQQVSDDIRARVLKAVKDTGYVADAVAGAFSSGKSNVIAVFVPSLTSSNFAETVRGINDVVEGGNLRLLLANTDYLIEREESLLRALLGHQPRGVILTGGKHTAKTRTLLQRANVPIVETWEIPPKPLDRVVGFSNSEAAAAMAQHLYQRGYRRIGFVGSASHLDTRGNARREGYLKAVAAAGLHAPRDVIPSEWGDDMAHGRAMGQGASALQAMLDQWPDTDAIMCNSDIHAFGVIMACHRRGLTVPKDVAVAGFGDFEVSRHCYPSITTVSVNPYAIGKLAGESLLAALESTEPPNASRRLIAANQRPAADVPKLIRIPYEIIARESA